MLANKLDILGIHFTPRKPLFIVYHLYTFLAMYRIYIAKEIGIIL